MIPLLGVDFADLTITQAAQLIAQRKTSFGYVVTPNADHLVRLSGDPTVQAIYRHAALCLLDSRVVAGLSRLLQLPTPKVVTGSDLTEHLLTHGLAPRETITIVGLSPIWLPALTKRFGLAPPNHHNPPMGFDQRALEDAVNFVRTHPARLIFLAIGSPRQEHLAAAIAATGEATGTALCIGASLEFLAGARRRAPRILRLLGLEWLFRLAAEPRRLARRYLRDSPQIIALLVKQRFARTPHA